MNHQQLDEISNDSVFDKIIQELKNKQAHLAPLKDRELTDVLKTKEEFAKRSEIFFSQLEK